MTRAGMVTVAGILGFTAVMVAQEQVAPAGSVMDPTLFAAAIVTVLAAIGGMIVQVINSVSAAHDRREAARERAALFERTNATATKADEIIKSTSQIHELTNSTNSSLQKALEIMTERASGFERALAQAAETKKDVAAAQAVIDMKQALAAPPPGAQPVGHMRIDTAAAVVSAASAQATSETLERMATNTQETAKNTEETAKNTAKEKA